MTRGREPSTYTGCFAEGGLMVTRKKGKDSVGDEKIRKSKKLSLVKETLKDLRVPNGTGRMVRGGRTGALTCTSCG